MKMVPSSLSNFARCLTAMLLGAAIAACSSVDLTPDNQRLNIEQIKQQRGQPLASYQTDSGQVFFYNRGNLHFERQKLTFDANGQLLSDSPAWSRATFNQVKDQQWESLDLLRTFGPPLAQNNNNPKSLLNLNPSNKSTTSKDTAATTYWVYGFKEFGKFFQVLIPISENGKVSAAAEISLDNTSTHQR